MPLQKMDNDQQVAVLLNLNETQGINSWQDDFSSATHNISINKISGSELHDHNLDSSSSCNLLMEQDLEFLKKHVVDADPEFLHSLLDSQIDNPKRLETVMCEILNIPNALELIQEFRKTPVKIGEKRLNNNHDSKPNDLKKQKINNSESYLQQIQDMFPDADDMFLINECQQLEKEDDFSRFVNTVMISGIYPKKRSIEFFSKIEYSPDKIDNNCEYTAVEAVSSEEEISSSVELDSSLQEKRKKQKNFKFYIDDKSKKISYNLVPPETDIIDLVSDTEPYSPDPETLEEVFNDIVSSKIEKENIICETLTMNTSLSDDIDNLLQEKFSVVVKKHNDWNTPETPKAGPSGLKVSPFHPKLSLSGGTDDSFVLEKSLEEIIEDHRHNRRRSLESRSQYYNDIQKPSTSKQKIHEIQTITIESVDDRILTEEISSPEISTTSNLSEKKYTTEVTILEERKEASKIKRERFDEQTASLIRIFPNTDPSYIREEVEKMQGSSEAINEFVISKLERNDMPTRAEYEKKMEMEELQNRYTNNFSIEDFLKAIPDPWKYFTQRNRNCAKYKNHSLCYLRSSFRKLYVRDIIKTFKKNNCNLYLSYHDLKKENIRKRGSQRSEFECNHNRPITIDIQFLQEVTFIENEEKIKDYIKGEKIARKIKFEEAKRNGSLLECQCCFDSEVMVEDIFYCPKDHPFCKECIIKSVEVEMGNGKCQFECLANCEEKFTLSSLQNVLRPELFSKVIQANQLEEIRAAEIEDLVQCPFCNYATIMPPEEKVMICLNPECLKESCRLCRELNHIPLRCDEVEKSEEVKMRTYIENKMTEALVRTCYKCGKKFVKEDGCNKMTCTCGAKMCYVCRKPVSGYSHFNGLGGTEHHKCPLYSLNDELHVDLVRKVAEEAKAEILQANPQIKLLHDPTIIMPERTNERSMPGMNNGAALNAGLRAIRGILNQQENEEHGRQRTAGDNNRRKNRHHENNSIRHYRHRQRNQIESEDENDYDNDHHFCHYHQRHCDVNHNRNHHRTVHQHQIHNNRHHHHRNHNNN